MVEPAERRDLLRSPEGRFRRAIQIALAALASFGAASCLGILGLDGYAAAPSELCALLNRCYGEAGFQKCEGYVSSQLEAADPAEKQKFLEHFASSECLESCTNARGCLDFAPVCRGPRDSCTSNEQCCGFSEATSTCARQSCCQTKGAACTSDAECCSETCFGNPKACGGNLCGETGAPCETDQQCCSKICIPGLNRVCGSACLDLGFQCTQDIECCTGKCSNNVCSKVDCAVDGDLCLADADCCTGTCDSALGVCGAGMCLPEGTACSPLNDKCCKGGSSILFCDPAERRCAKITSCTTNGVSCANDDECCSLHCNGSNCSCAPLGTPCFEQEPFKCCSRFCDNGSCAAKRGTGEPCNTSDACDSGVCYSSVCCAKAACSHGVCTAGESLSPETCTPDQVGSAEAECVRTICDQDPQCCCSGWDQSCVDQVATVCKLTCSP